MSVKLYALFEQLETNRDYYYFSHQNIDEKGAGVVSEVLNKGQPEEIESMDFSHSRITAMSLNIFSKNLAIYRKLTWIDFSFNQIKGAAGGKAVAAILSSLSLIFISLNNNELGTDGVKEIVPVLSSHKTLQKIDLSGNKIGTEGLEAVFECLQTNKVLKELMIGFNTFSCAERSYSALLERNVTLVKIDMDLTQMELFSIGIKLNKREKRRESGRQTIRRSMSSQKQNRKPEWPMLLSMLAPRVSNKK